MQPFPEWKQNYFPIHVVISSSLTFQEHPTLTFQGHLSGNFLEGRQWCQVDNILSTTYVTIDINILTRQNICITGKVFFFLLNVEDLSIDSRRQCHKIVNLLKCPQTYMPKSGWYIAMTIPYNLKHALVAKYYSIKIIYKTFCRVLEKQDFSNFVNLGFFLMNEAY